MNIIILYVYRNVNDRTDLFFVFVRFGTMRVLKTRSVSFVTERQGLVGQEATHHRRWYLKTAGHTFPQVHLEA